ncbi:hypothetical protein AcW1_007565 [Taiwanofungus camphoratus]|nr:hypothetical protein AcV7_009766 [Antrodia cinnamomea]KAI0953317.1 hypothetical protein AcW1_007565 [Antrodia cinnamomea]
MATFKPNRCLLNPKFEGYKLAPLEQEQVVSHHALQYKPSQANVSGRSHVSFQEVQSRISHNHLTISPTNGTAVYVDRELKVISIHVDDTTLVPSFRLLYELPRPIYSPKADSPQREYPSVTFLNASSLFTADGYGNLHALHIPDSGKAELLGTFELSTGPTYGSANGVVPFRIYQAVQITPQTAVVILSSKKYPSDSSRPNSLSDIRSKVPSAEFDIWAVRFALPLLQTDQRPRALDILWHRRGEDVPVYTAYDEARDAFVLVGNSSYRSVDVAPKPTYEPSADELAPIPRAGENLDAASTVSQPQKPPPYSWTQTEDSVTVAIPLPSSTRVDSIKVTFSPRTLTVFIRSDLTLPDTTDSSAHVKPPHYDMKALWDTIQPSTSFWTWDRAAEHTFGVLTLHLDKAHEGTRWSQVFAAAGASASADMREEDLEVPETLDPSELYAIREALEKYTAALRDGHDGRGLGLGHGVPSLAEGEIDDEVDLGMGRVVCITWIRADGAQPLYTHGSDSPVSLLSTPFPGVEPSGRPSLVVKNGLDGVVYELNAATSPEDPPKWIHSATFSALSFVLASKRDTRFTYHMSPKAVFAFESGSRELGGNVYIYRGGSSREKWAKQAVLKIGGYAGPLLGVGMIKTKGNKLIVLCLCEEELIVLHDVL